VSGEQRDTALLAFGVLLACWQQAAYTLGGVEPNLLFLVLSVGCLLGATVLSTVIDILLSFIPGVARPERGKKDSDET
jgi:hypothetical protein